MAQQSRITIPQRVGDPEELDYSVPAPTDFGELARDRIPVRSLRESDLKALIAIDRRITGRDRSGYFERKLSEALHESDVRVSLVAEADGRPVGFIMARVDLGEFGRIEAAAVMDTIGVDPDYAGHGVGRALLSQLLANLATLRVDKILTEVDWADRELMAYLDRCGFRPSGRLSFDCLLS
ncbi:MAG: GNAT family N-acetyltransferase [Rhodoplanes sp.]|jgi:ribosomal protein S18 acetylase RimI-like enzyme